MVEDCAYWLNMLETISISASAAAIFSAEEGCGLWPKRKDILAVMSVWAQRDVGVVCDVVIINDFLKVTIEDLVPAARMGLELGPS